MTSGPAGYQARSYWQQRLGEDPSLAGVGYAALGLPFNVALYRQRERVLRRAVTRLRLPIGGARVLELGVGSGFYLPVWGSLGVADLVGLDITDVAVARLSERHPHWTFRQADISQPLPVEPGSFDIVTAFDVLLHVVDEAGFDAALRHAAAACRPGGHLLVSDLFLERGEPPAAGAHNAVRTLARYRAALESAGWQVVGRLPIFVTMHPAYDLPAGRGRDLALAWWRWLAARLRRRPQDGRWLGAVLEAVDAVLTAGLRDGPSNELLVARRTSAGPAGERSA